jgi:hypothetical protein
MSSVAVFLTSRSTRILVGSMRRVLRVRVAYEATRHSEEQLEVVYEQVVPTVRRAYAHGDDGSSSSQRAKRRSAVRERRKEAR